MNKEFIISGGSLLLAGAMAWTLVNYYPNKADAQNIARDEVKSVFCTVKEDLSEIKTDIKEINKELYLINQRIK